MHASIYLSIANIVSSYRSITHTTVYIPVLFLFLVPKNYQNPLLHLFFPIQLLFLIFLPLFHPFAYLSNLLYHLLQIVLTKKDEENHDKDRSCMAKKPQHGVKMRDHTLAIQV